VWNCPLQWSFDFLKHCSWQVTFWMLSSCCKSYIIQKGMCIYCM
jgi:hypothetical protein